MASLANTNKYLTTESMRRKVVRVAVATSSAIEGIYAPLREIKTVAMAVVATKKPRQIKN